MYTLLYNVYTSYLKVANLLFSFSVQVGCELLTRLHIVVTYAGWNHDSDHA